MTSLPNDDYFYHPPREDLLKGLECEDPECKGHYVPKFRDITMRRAGGNINIKNSEYWECEECGNFVTSKEEVKRIGEESKKQEVRYNGRLTLRLDADLHKKLAAKAEKNRRSLNNELIYRLERSLEK